MTDTNLIHLYMEPAQGAVEHETLCGMGLDDVREAGSALACAGKDRKIPEGFTVCTKCKRMEEG